MLQVGKNNLKQIKEIDLILGVNEKSQLIHYIEQYEKDHIKKEEISDVMQQKEYCDFGTVDYTEKTRAVVKIQDGCDRFCTYCIIPYARGRVRSRKPESVIDEVRKIAKKGIKEIVITGIHIASYGKDFGENYHLIDLLEKLNEIEGIERIRLGSIEPTIINEEFMNRLKKLDKICEHFHLSLQSGSNQTLKRMNRKYTIEQFEQGVELIRNTYSNVVLTTDIIVGFPGETEEEFKETYEFLKRIHFYKMHIFKYSQRKGTKAAIMPNQIDGKKKEERSKCLIALSEQNEREKNETYIGKIVKVLFEEQEGEYIKGHTSNYIVVKVKTRNIKIENKILEVMILKEENLELIGNLQNTID